MTRVSGVYAIRHRRTEQTYLGSTKDLLTRWSTHLSTLNVGRHSNRSLQAAWDQDGSDAFELELVEEIDPKGSDLDAAERRCYAELAAAGVPLFAEKHVTRNDVVHVGFLLPGLKSLRQYHNLTMRGLAARAKVGANTIWRIEHGEEAIPATIGKLAEALGVHPQVLKDAPK